MYTTLYQYLIFHKQLILPGVGTIQLQRTSPQLDYSNKIFTAPLYHFKIDSRSDKPSKKFYEWLSQLLAITEWEAIKIVNDFSFELKKNISLNGEVTWENVGVLRRDEKGSIILESPNIELESEGSVIAEKVIREKPDHPVLVGEIERASTEMEELLMESPSKRDYAWLIALVLTVAALMFVGWYFSEKGVNISSTGNQSVIKAK